MIWILGVLCLAQAAALAYTFRCLVRLVREGEQTHALERATLLNRIQAPEHAVAQSLVPDMDVDEPAVHPDLPEEYFEAFERLEQG